MALMPYLSTYMGHVTLEETLYYVHLLPERLKSSPGHELFYPQLGVKLCSMAGGGVQKIYMVFFKRTVPAGQVRQ